MTALGALWRATKGDGLVALIARARSDGPMSDMNGLSVRLVRLRSNAAGSRVDTCFGYTDFTNKFTLYRNNGMLTAAGQGKFFINGEIEGVFRQLTNATTQALNPVIGVEGHFILNDARTRVKEFLIAHSDGGSTIPMFRWIQKNATSAFEIV